MLRRHAPYALAAAALLGVIVGCAPDDLPDEQVLARGERLYNMHCVACHGGPSGGTISDIPPRHNAQGHTWHHPDCQLVGIVLEGMPPREGFPTMPAFADDLDENDVGAILAHIKTWWEPDQVEFQADITDQVC
jgi:mono/diheme cytochrome c family protein